MLANELITFCELTSGDAVPLNVLVSIVVDPVLVTFFAPNTSTYVPSSAEVSSANRILYIVTLQVPAVPFCPRSLALPPLMSAVKVANGVDSPFDMIESGMDIEFRLAQLDPDGNTTNGVIFHQYEEGFALNGSKDADIQKYAWNNAQYMNVYIQVVLKAGSTTN